MVGRKGGRMAVDGTPNARQQHPIPSSSGNFPTAKTSDAASLMEHAAVTVFSADPLYLFLAVAHPSLPPLSPVPRVLFPALQQEFIHLLRALRGAGQAAPSQHPRHQLQPGGDMVAFLSGSLRATRMHGPQGII